MKRHLTKKERKVQGATHARKLPKKKFIDNEGNKGRDYFFKVTEGKNIKK